MSNTNTHTPPVKAVVFDMAGTTIDEGKMVYECVRKTLEKFGLHYSLEEVMERVGGMNKKEGIKELMTLKMGNVEKEKAEEAAEIFRNMVEEAYRTSTFVKEMPGASDLFSHLQRQNIKVVLDTGYIRSTADLLIEKMGWQEKKLIDFSVTSDEVSQGRPAPLMIRKALAHLNIHDAGDTVKVGDTRSDVEEGINAGCRYVVGIISSQYTKEELLAMGATHAIHSLEELKAILAA